MQVEMIPIDVYVDNKSLVSCMKNDKVTDKRLLVEVAMTKQSLADNEIRYVNWCPTKYQLADCLTKNTSNMQLIDAMEAMKLPLFIKK